MDSTRKRGTGNLDVAELKRVAQGRWVEILTSVAGLPGEALDGRNHPCPKCGGTDRFRLIDAGRGAVLCNQCFKKENGDGLAAVQWAIGCTFPEAVRRVAQHLGLDAAAMQTKAKPEIVATYDYRDEQGRLLFQVCRTEPKGFLQRAPKDGGGRDWNTKGVRRVVYRLPELLAADPATPVYIAEGEKAVDRLVKAGAVATCSPGGAGKWLPEFAQHFAGRRVVLLADNDTPGKAHAQKVAQSLHGVATTVKVLELPGLAEKADAYDWLEAGGTLDELQRLADAAAEWTATQADELPQIVVDVDEGRVLDEAEAALAKRGGIYQRGGHLVEIVVDTWMPEGIRSVEPGPRMASIKLHRLRELLARSAAFVVEAEKGPRRVHVPDWVPKSLDARPAWPAISHLTGIVESPTLLADGQVLQAPGRDRRTGLLYAPTADFPPVPANPTIEDAKAAVDALLHVVIDFPFASPAHRSAWLAGVLTPFARWAIAGPKPLILYEANAQGTGKSLLANTTALIATGRTAPIMANPGDDDEARKRITALAMMGAPLVVIDNIRGTFGTPALEAALTGETWTDRVLGASEITTAPLDLVWYATGNNATITRDIARRVLVCRIETDLEAPEERTGFVHENLADWVRSERPRLAVAALTILAAYLRAGAPKQGLAEWGSFEAWTGLIRNAIVWAGQPDPAQNRRQIVGAADLETAALRRMIDALAENDPYETGLRTAEIIKLVVETPREHEALREAIADLCPTRDGKLPNARGLGMKLHHLRRRIVPGGGFIDSKPSRLGELWYATSTEKRKTSGTSGTKNHHPYAPAQAHAPAPAPAHTRPTCFSPATTASPADAPSDEVDEWTC